MTIPENWASIEPPISNPPYTNTNTNINPKQLKNKSQYSEEDEDEEEDSDDSESNSEDGMFLKFLRLSLEVRSGFEPGTSCILSKHFASRV